MQESRIFELTLLLHTCATFVMVGIIWMVQLVHYPLFAQVGETSFRTYEIAHMNAMSLLVMPVMLVELLTGLALIALPSSVGIAQWMPLASLGLIAALWFVTLFVNLPQHSSLSTGFSADLHSTLVQSNWIRTALWTGRGILVLWMLERLTASP